jgi:hypothetical protein
MNRKPEGLLYDWMGKFESAFPSDTHKAPLSKPGGYRLKGWGRCCVKKSSGNTIIYFQDEIFQVDFIKDA